MMSRRPAFVHAAWFLSGALSVVLMGVLVLTASGRWRSAVAGAQRLLGAPVVGLEIPPDVLRELRERRGVIDNADNLTPQTEHETILSQPDAEIEFVLRPQVRLTGNVLSTTGSMNLDPPVLYLPSGTPLTGPAREWLRSSTRLEFEYSTDESGHRLTLPLVDSDRTILIVGDSVAFGVGVGDRATVASQLQQLLGGAARVINAGVGEYDGDQAFLMAEKLSRNTRHAALVYIACQNDFDTVEQARSVLERFGTIANRFDGNVIVILETYLEYNSRDVLLEQGWPPSAIGLTDQLRATVPRVALALGFRYADWTELVETYRQSVRSVFAPFALYVDHGHLSGIGTRLMAERIRMLLGT